MKKIGLLLLTIITMVSCSDRKNLIGKWDDIIKLSTKNVEFSASADSVTIKTGGDWWWINYISFDDSIYIYNNRQDIDILANSYTIVEDNFKVIRRDKNTLFVRVNPNTTGAERNMRILLEAGDYFDGISLKQKAD